MCDSHSCHEILDCTLSLLWLYDTCAQKLANSQLNLPYRTKQKSNEETKNKNRDAQKKQTSHEVRGVSPEAERESTVGKICESTEGCSVHDEKSYCPDTHTHMQPTDCSTWPLKCR